MVMRTSLRKIGNSRGIIIPAALLAAAEIGDEVELRQEAGKLVIEAVKAPRAGWAEAAASNCRAGRRMRKRGPISSRTKMTESGYGESAGPAGRGLAGSSGSTLGAEIKKRALAGGVAPGNP